MLDQELVTSHFYFLLVLHEINLVRILDDLSFQYFIVALAYINSLLMSIDIRFDSFYNERRI